MTINFDNVKITKTETKTGYYDNKKQKHLDYKKPKITKKIVFEENCYDLGQFYEAMCFARRQLNTYGDDTLTVEFKLTEEY
tara:strand:- start:37 stop:279 length:243 start_codon:yes stop_codon:yes gene_type:complete